MTDEDFADYRKGFEIELLFDHHKLVNGRPGVLVRNPDGTYADMFIEAAWRGYQMYVKHANNLLERYCEGRYIGSAVEARFREISAFEHPEGTGVDDAYFPDLIRSALQACKETPI